MWRGQGNIGRGGGGLFEFGTVLAEGISPLHTKSFITVSSVFALDTVPASRRNVKRLERCCHNVGWH